ncbi:hypothetical protein FOQG_19169 [Fusarium oxysporum f. sp. raphani 54005]|uniref:Transcription factor domain-containing protein n=2 Tax=Fusarium oxysporum f. sp. raphani TaxID=96318 RepID=X0B1R4_FUSOX|nr:hypothetical protein FOQG_19169 [Fusarium oxysporum f. sp. raphani 54005]KAG7408064.1 hypothetical protein Forpi1262_v018006 [Fusarium oxysporum f. sp. raphani]
MAEVMELGVPRCTDSQTMQELKRRIRWSLFMADYWQGAIKGSSLLCTAKELGKCEILHTKVGQGVVIDSSALLHTALFGKEDETVEAQSSLQSNFEVLQELALYRPSLELTVRRFTVFQRGCMQRAFSDLHQFDKRALAFLQEHHLTLDERFYL